MGKQSRILRITNEKDLKIFWKMFDVYIKEIAKNATAGDEVDLEYFCGEEYKNIIEKLWVREKNPIRLMFIKLEDRIIGFCMYAIYLDEGGKCFLMEYYIELEYRNKKYGERTYYQIEDRVKEEGALFIELTPTSDDGERFWKRVGLEKTMDKDEDNKYYYRKYL